MRAIRARAIRRLENQRRIARRLGMAQANAALGAAIAEARKGGPRWRERAREPVVEVTLEGNALDAQRWLDAAERALA